MGGSKAVITSIGIDPALHGLAEKFHGIRQRRFPGKRNSKATEDRGTNVSRMIQQVNSDDQRSARDRGVPEELDATDLLDHEFPVLIGVVIIEGVRGAELE